MKIFRERKKGPFWSLKPPGAGAGTETFAAGMLLYVALNILGFFTETFHWVWEVPSIIVLFGSLALGAVLYWLVIGVIRMSKTNKKQVL